MDDVPLIFIGWNSEFHGEIVGYKGDVNVGTLKFIFLTTIIRRRDMLESF